MRLPSHTTIAAYGALFVALGGTSYAAATLPKNSVGSRQIRDRSVQVRDLARAARPITRARLAESVTEILTDPTSGLQITVHGEKGDAGPQGPAGPAGPAGTPGVANVVVREGDGPDVVAGGTSGAVAKCADGETILGGGGRFIGQSPASMRESSPSVGEQGWTVVFDNIGPSNGHAHAFAICAEVNR